MLNGQNVLGSQYMLYSLEESYNVGDTVNVRAQVHNTGNANIQSGTNVLVRFYDGDPANGGTLIGSTTITNGIPQGSSQTATIQYTITHLPVNVYVSVDPLNSITEQSESNNKAYKVMSSDPESVDSDGDGLTDVVETSGMYVGYPYGYIYTDPSNDDTDGDGLLDSEEVVYHSDTGTYELISYPDSVDSDNDGLDDYEEYDLGAIPFLVDSDDDGIIDCIDGNPLIFDTLEVEPDIFQIIGIIAKGITFGDMGYEGGVFYWFVGDDSNSPYYLVGVIIRGFIPLSDVTDFAQAVLNWDGTGALLSALGLVPVVGDAGRIAGQIGTFVGKHPNEVVRIAIIVVKWVLKELPINEIKRAGLDALHCNKATELIARGGIVEDDLLELVENGGLLSNTLDVAKRQDSIRWLETGENYLVIDKMGKLKDTGYGWAHIIRPSRFNKLKEKFLINLGSVDADQAKIKELIFDTIKTGTERTTYKDGIAIKYEYVKEIRRDSNKVYQLLVVVGNIPREKGGIGMGNIITAHHIELRYN